jgi:2-keto-4-pentenoate hydratase/2-oxohepta-3-ene-1,7-dioic acid hydratase in catechol pathway
VDLPDAVGHPAFPATMEALVASNGGTVLDAAEAALERDDALASAVADPRLLAPLLPRSFRSRDAPEAARRVVGPDDAIDWPPGAGWLEYKPKIAAVLRRPVDRVDRAGIRGAIFGFTLVSDWAARDANGDPTPHPEAVPLALGPCIVTPDEIDPQTAYIAVRVDGQQWIKGNLNGIASDLIEAVTRTSRVEHLEPGEAFASSPFDIPGFEQRLWPGATIELEAEGIGVLTNALARSA